MASQKKERPFWLKRHRDLPWFHLAEPVHWGYGNLDTLLTGVEHMLDTSRAYQRGYHGPINALIESSAYERPEASWCANGTSRALMDACLRVLTIGMLTQRYDAPRWREECGIAMTRRVRLTGPFDTRGQLQRDAWDRLRALDGVRIQPLNESHPAARQLRFHGIGIHDGRKARTWSLNFSVQYPREKFGSFWSLDSLLHPWRQEPRYCLRRSKTETFTAWCHRVADFIDGLRIDRTHRTGERPALAARLRAHYRTKKEAPATA